MVTEQAYNVLDKELVADKLNLNFSPVGLYVEDAGNTESCIVEVIPRTDQPQLQVSNQTLKELLEQDAIKQK